MAKEQKPVSEDTFVMEKKGKKIKRVYEKHKFATGMVAGFLLGLAADVAAGIFKEKKETAAVEADPWVGVTEE